MRRGLARFGDDTKIEHLHVAIGHVEALLASSSFPFSRILRAIFPNVRKDIRSRKSPRISLLFFNVWLTISDFSETNECAHAALFLALNIARFVEDICILQYKLKIRL